MRKTRIVAFLCVLAAFTPCMLQAQITTTTLLGAVTDSTGAVLPGATVSARNTETNLTRTVQANEEGAYRIDFLPVVHIRSRSAIQGSRRLSKGMLS